jgi:hypothetical protein
LSTKRYTVGEETLKLISEGQVRVLRGKKLKLGKYKITRRYIVKGVVNGCKSETESFKRE